MMSWCSKQPEFAFMLFDKVNKKYIGSYKNHVWLSENGAKSAIRFSRHTHIELHKFSLSLVEKIDYTAKKLIDVL
jgi:hypothetical protein